MMLCLMLSSCASPHYTSNTTFKSDLTKSGKPVLEEAVIKVSRSSSLAWHNLSICILDANTPIGILGANGGELEWRHPPGYVAIITSFVLPSYKDIPTNAVIVRVEAGKTYSFHIDQLMYVRAALKPDTPSETPILYETTSEPNWPTQKPITDEWKSKLVELEFQEARKLNGNISYGDIASKYASPKDELPGNWRQMAEEYFYKEIPYVSAFNKNNASYTHKRIASISPPVFGHAAAKWGWLVVLSENDMLDAQGIKANWATKYRLFFSKGRIIGYVPVGEFDYDIAADKWNF
jgi:hypothetical protein